MQTEDCKRKMMWLHDNFHKLKLMVKFGVNVNIHSCFPFPMASTKNVSESYFLVTDTAISQSMMICNCQPVYTSGGWQVVAGDLHGRSLSVNSHQLLTKQPSNGNFRNNHRSPSK